ncbi:hypothetical protein RDI61_28835, partial [Pseudomonas plecoglossicida]|nr:hypothetical protein [Pseudomonas plecoglossicida]
LPLLENQVSNVWSMGKDGRSYWPIKVTAPLTQHSNRLANPGCCAPDFLLAPIRHDATSMQKSKISSPNRRLLKIHRRPTCSGQVGHQSRGI